MRVGHFECFDDTNIQTKATLMIEKSERISKHEVGLLNLAEQLKKFIKIGLSAHLTTVVTSPNQALILPLEYIIDDAKKLKPRVERSEKNNFFSSE